MMVCQKMCHENELITQIIHAEAGLSPGGWRVSQHLKEAPGRCPWAGLRGLTAFPVGQVVPRARRGGGPALQPQLQPPLALLQPPLPGLQGQPVGRGEETGSHPVPASQESHKAWRRRLGSSDPRRTHPGGPSRGGTEAAWHRTLLLSAAGDGGSGPVGWGGGRQGAPPAGRCPSLPQRSRSPSGRACPACLGRHADCRPPASALHGPGTGGSLRIPVPCQGPWGRQSGLTSAPAGPPRTLYEPTPASQPSRPSLPRAPRHPRPPRPGPRPPWRSGARASSGRSSGKASRRRCHRRPRSARLRCR